MSKTKADPNYKVIAENRRARFDYAIESDLECGVVLFGSEVKSLRVGGSNIAESYAQIENGELWNDVKKRQKIALAEEQKDFFE